MLKTFVAYITMFLILSKPANASWWDCIKVFSVQTKTESTSSWFGGRIADLAYSIKRIKYRLDLQSLAKTYPEVLVLAENAGISIKDYRKYPGLQQIDKFFRQVAINLDAKGLDPINYLKLLARGDKTILAEIQALETRIAERGIKVTWNTREDQDVSNVSGNHISVLTSQAITKEPIPTVLSTINHELDHTLKEFTVSRDTDVNEFADQVISMMIDDEVRVRLLQIKYDQHLIDVGVLKISESTVSTLNDQMTKVLNQSSLTEAQKARRVRDIVQADYYVSTQSNVTSYWMSEQTQIDIRLFKEWLSQNSKDAKDAYSIIRTSARRQMIGSQKVRDEYDQMVISKAAEEAGESTAFAEDLTRKMKVFADRDPPSAKAKN